MAKFEKGNTIGKRFGKDLPTDKGGRPKKFLTTLKEQGYKKSEVMDVLQVIFSMTVPELQKIQNDPERDALERTVAAAIISGFKKRSQYNILQLLERVYGKPKETLDHNLHGKVKVSFKLGGKS